MVDYAERARLYRERAAEAQAKAETMKSASTREALVLVAADYLSMAEAMEQIADSKRAIRGEISN